MPNTNNKQTAAGLKIELKKMNNQRRYAWGQYFQMRNEMFELQEQMYNQINEQYDDEEPVEAQEIKLEDLDNEFLMKFIKQLYKDAKASVECPICLEKIEVDDLDTTGCGHNYHKDCLQQLKDTASGKFANCAVCRRKVFKN